MKPKQATYSLIIVLVLLFVFIFKRWHEPIPKEAFDRHPSHLYYTKHALCRMDCRNISKSDIDEIMHKGIINFNKTNRRDRPCPTFALQGQTSDGEKIRVIFAQCSNETKVVTCYNLEEDFECDCPSTRSGHVPSTGSGPAHSTLRHAQYKLSSEQALSVISAKVPVPH